MKGLLLKDLYNLKLYMRQFLFMAVCLMVFGLGMDMPSYCTFMSIVLGINIAFSGYVMDEAGGYVYLLSCPVGRKIIVQEKYLFVILCAVLMFLYSALGEMLSRLLHGTATKMWLGQMLIVLGFYFILMSILTPVAYRYGVEKARIVIVLVVILPVAAAFLAVQFMQTEKLVRIARPFAAVGPFLFLALSLLIMGGSYQISRKIIEKTEF